MITEIKRIVSYLLTGMAAGNSRDNCPVSEYKEKDHALFSTGL